MATFILVEMPVAYSDNLETLVRLNFTSATQVSVATNNPLRKMGNHHAQVFNYMLVYGLTHHTTISKDLSIITNYTVIP